MSDAEKPNDPGAPPPAPKPAAKKKPPAKKKRAAAAPAPAAEKPVNKGGRPEHEPTEKDRQTVKMLTAMGIAQDDVCKVVGISEPTLRKHYEKELATGIIEANAKVAGALYKAAMNSTKPNVTAMIFWLKARAGWREDPTHGKGPPLVPPTPQPPAPPPLGKKEEAELGAVGSQLGTEWEDLLPNGRPSPRSLQ